MIRPHRPQGSVAAELAPSAPAAPVIPANRIAPPAAAEVPPPPPVLPAGDEAYRVLLGLAHRHTGRIPADVLVKQAMRAGTGGGWPVEKAALEAILRRVALHARDRLVVGKRPGSGPFGPQPDRAHEFGRMAKGRIIRTDNDLRQQGNNLTIMSQRVFQRLFNHIADHAVSLRAQ